MFAAAITNYDGTTDPIEDPEVGTLKLYYKSWDVEAENGSLKFEEIPTRPCTTEDFAFQG